MNAGLIHAHHSVFVFIVMWAYFISFLCFAESVVRKGKRMGKAWGIFPWKCARRCRRKEWPLTMKWQMNWWQNSAHQTTTCHRMTQWALQLRDIVSEWSRRNTPDENFRNWKLYVELYFINILTLVPRLPYSPFQHVYDQKNIRRRVYDALNVLMAMNIISKEKKEIKWIGLPTNSAQECQNLEVETAWRRSPLPLLPAW